MMMTKRRMVFDALGLFACTRKLGAYLDAVSVFNPVIEPKISSHSVGREKKHF